MSTPDLATDMQESVESYLHGLAEYEQRELKDTDCCTPEVALRELLRGRAGYSDPTTCNSLAPYREGAVSLPESTTDSPCIADVGGPGSQFFLTEEGERMVLPDCDVPDTLPIVYSDPALVKHRQKYARFVKDLDGRGMLDFTVQPKEMVGVFFVWKKGREKIRLILDARRANKRFRRPPHVDLVSGEGLSMVDLDISGDSSWSEEELLSILRTLRVSAGISDVKDAFRRLRMPRWLRPYFCLPPVRACDLGFSEVEGQPLDKGDPVWPMPRSFPMGFSWSLFYCQDTGENLSCSVPSLSSSSLLCDRGRPLILRVFGGGRDELRHYIYVDNIGVIGLVFDAVKGALLEVTEVFTRNHLDLHGTEVTDENVEMLGVLLDARQTCTRVLSRRAYRLRQGIAALLQRGRCSGAQLEVILGHCTFAALVRRGVLCCFSAVYRFVQSSYTKVTPLWESVVEELSAFSGLLILLVSDWSSPWNRVVCATDASETGYGCTQAWCDRAEVASIGSVRERDRYLLAEGRQARLSAFRDSVFTPKVEFSLDLEDGQILDSPLDDLEESESAGVRASLLSGLLRVNKSFTEVPDSLLTFDRWETVFYGLW